MARLIFIPVTPGAKSGYEMAVAHDMERLSPSRSDAVVVAAQGRSHGGVAGWADRTRSLLCVLRGAPAAEAAARAVLNEEATEGPYEELFCGDSALYRPLRERFPRSRMTVRMHNLFTLIAKRQRLHKLPIGLALKFNIFAFIKVEREIASDPLVHPICITPQEAEAFARIFGRADVEVWNPVSKVCPAAMARSVTVRHLVWVGGLSSHKRFALRLFIQRVVPVVRSAFPDLEVHLFGRGTETLDQPKLRIHGHGVVEKLDVCAYGVPLLINPDLLGGGVKLKVADWIRGGLPFISTPYGVEGYCLPNEVNYQVVSFANWPEAIIDWLRRV